MRDESKSNTPQSAAAVEGMNHRLAHDGSPSSAVASGGAVDDCTPFPGWKHVRRMRRRETERERARRLEAEREAALHANVDMGVLR